MNTLAPMSSSLRAALVALFLSACAARPRPEDATRVARERLVQSTGSADRDRWFASVYALQSLLGADERLRAESLSRLAASLNLASDADADAIAAAVHTRAVNEHATLTLASSDPPPSVSNAVDLWAQALVAHDLELSDFDQVLHLDQGLTLSVECQPASATSCSVIAPELTRALRTTVVRHSMFQALAGLPELRDAVTARADLVAQGAPAALVYEFSAAREFLRGLHARSSAMADANARREQWIHSIAASGDEE